MNGNWLRTAPPSICLALLSCLPLLCVADANTGEMAGYRLGDAYPLTANTATSSAADRSLKLKAEQGVPPEGMDSVYLYVTPASHTIGKIVLHRDYPDLDAAGRAADVYRERLETQYPGWERLKAPIPMGKAGGEMVSRLRQGPYALIVFYRGTEQGAELVVELEYESASPERKAWKSRLRDELGAS